ncbi:MAG TPA: hypothetical protein VHM67_15285, partial [Gemmatimonadaceae bacterium]|nr:hypothetical protein [Gemmatimonadaceae bacterium]
YRNYSRLTDSDCGLDSTPAHPEPVALVREFVDRDGRAEFARGSDWLVNAVLCPGHLPGPDSFVAIDTAVLLTAGIQVASDTAWVPVRYEVLGEASPLGFDPAPATLVDTFLVTRTSAGWRVVAPNMPMRIRATVATEWRELLSDSLRAVIRNAADASRARRAGGA